MYYRKDIMYEWAGRYIWIEDDVRSALKGNAGSYIERCLVLLILLGFNTSSFSCPLGYSLELYEKHHQNIVNLKKRS